MKSTRKAEAKQVDRAGRTPLHHAAFDDDVSTIEDLIAQGSSPDTQDRQGFTPLHFAAQQYSVNAASALLEAGASVDPENTFGNTPLFTAVFNSNGRGELIEVLRAHGADPLRVNKHGQTPVGLARLIANYEVSRFFMDLPE
ncbi:ankyrin repeat domain-containing protein [Paenarthrobacter sp. NPDC092416]|uniref:ankyrin repeat domain-containing protein n=1 Tax=Paenarthrobacter sp. NPDC092416 TaxID=3364386 RepID=UPI003830E14D